MARKSHTPAELAARSETRRLKKNTALSAWRKKNRARYNAYIREWRARKKAEVEAPKARMAESDMGTRTTTIEIDEAKLAGAKRVLGTRTLRETVDRSFDEVLARAAREKSITRLQEMDGLDLDQPDVMAKAWR